jgi:hypothetical protein
MQGTVTAVWWDGPYFHPREFKGADVTADLIDSMRVAKKQQSNALRCNAAAALRSAKSLLPLVHHRRHAAATCCLVYSN